MNNRNWNVIRGIKVGNNINNDDEPFIKLNIKIKRIVNLEFSETNFILFGFCKDNSISAFGCNFLNIS